MKAKNKIVTKTWKHDWLMNKTVNEIKNKKYQKTKKIEVEKEYNDYGNRGVIDIYHEYTELLCLNENQIPHTVIDIYEVKPILWDIWEGVRQLKKAKRATCNGTPYFLRLMILNLEENVEVIKDNLSALSHVDNQFSILAFDINTTQSGCFFPHVIDKYGDDYDIDEVINLNLCYGKKPITLKQLEKINWVK